MRVSNPIVVYYSLEGNTAYAAEKIAAALGAKTLRLQPKKAYPDSGFRKFFWGGKSAVMAAARVRRARSSSCGVADP